MRITKLRKITATQEQSRTYSVDQRTCPDDPRCTACFLTSVSLRLETTIHGGVREESKGPKRKYHEACGHLMSYFSGRAGAVVRVRLSLHDLMSDLCLQTLRGSVRL